MTGAVDPPASSIIDSTVPHSARIWNYWLGGKDNYAVDREAGDAWMAVQPEIVEIARVARAFLGRSVRYLAGEVGIRQFLDIGTGLPTADNTHEVAQRVAPDARVVYVDNDPLVLTHARALLTSQSGGETRYLHADMHDRDALIAGASEILDLTQPTAVLFIGVLGHVDDLDEARGLVRGVMERMPSGSYLVLTDATVTTDDGGRAQQAEDDYAERGAVAYRSRTPEEITGFFDGLDPVEPGLVSPSSWRPEAAPGGADIDGPGARPINGLAGVARKP